VIPLQEKFFKAGKNLKSSRRNAAPKFWHHAILDGVEGLALRCYTGSWGCGDWFYLS